MASILKAGQEFLMKFRVRKAPSSSADVSESQNEESEESANLLESDEEMDESNVSLLKTKASKNSTLVKKKKAIPIIIDDEDSDSDTSYNSPPQNKKIKVWIVFKF